MKTIAIDLRVLSTGRLSGIEEYTEQIASHLISLDAGVRWKLFYTGRRQLEPRAWMLSPRVTLHEFRRSNRMLSLMTRLSGHPKLDSLIGGADAFLFPHFLLGAVSRGCRRVMTWHDLSYERMPYLLSPYRRFWHAVQMRPRWQARSADRIIAVSEATAADIEDLYHIGHDRIVVVHSGIDAALRRASEAAVQRWRGRHGIEAPFILALGTREPRKNLVSVVRAWDALRGSRTSGGVHLVIAGHRGWGSSELERAIASSCAPQDIHVLDAISREERPLLLSAASVLAYPSLMEGFGFPPLEAMACGTPVIAGATSSLFETVGDAGLLIDPYRTDELRSAMEAVLSDAGLRSRLISRGLERVRRFSWERAAEETLRVLLSVL